MGKLKEFGSAVRRSLPLFAAGAGGSALGVASTGVPVSLVVFAAACMIFIGTGRVTLGLGVALRKKG